MAKVKYNKGCLDSTMKAAIKVTENGGTVYVFATAYGYTIDSRKPAFGQSFIQVTDGAKVEAAELKAGDTIKANGINYVIVDIDTPESHFDAGRKNLAKAMHDTNRIYSGVVRRPRGQKLYFFNCYRSGRIEVGKVSIA